MAEIPTIATLKACSVTGTTDVNGDITVELAVPGTFNPAKPERLLFSGNAGFDAPAVGDVITAIEIYDPLNKLGAGAGYVAESYIDKEVPSGNQCIEIIKIKGYYEINSVAGEGRALGELSLRIKAKAAASRSDTFRVNINWAKPT